LTSVHIDISKKVTEKVNAIEAYKKMDQDREAIITNLVEDYRLGKDIDLQPLNDWTNEMNTFAVANQLPVRKNVTKEMIEAYIKSIS